jgi:hypothetical protein
VPAAIVVIAALLSALVLAKIWVQFTSGTESLLPILPRRKFGPVGSGIGVGPGSGSAPALELEELLKLDEDTELDEEDILAELSLFDETLDALLKLELI